MLAEALDRHRLSFVSRSEDPEMRRIRETIAQPLLVDSRGELEAVVCRLLDEGRPGVPKTLDLIGHSAASTQLLVLGEWVIDATSPTVTAFFRELAEQNVLARLGVTAVRLLGCQTADTAHGRWTVCALADILGVEVYGTTGLLLASHCDRDGFADERRYLLASASQLRANGPVVRPLDRGEPTAFALDVDMLPAVALPERPWPVQVLDAETARELLCLVERRNGSVLAGLVAAPTCEVALPSPDADRYYLVQVLLDAQLVRVYPPGMDDGVVYPVADPVDLQKLLLTARRSGGRARTGA
jgi:hypothetical protein